MRALRIPAILVVVLFVSHGTAAEGALANDAGSGHDAGDSAASAVQLTSFGGPYAGTLSHQDVDVYALPAVSSPACVRATVSGEKQGVAALSLGDASAELAFAASTVQVSVASSSGSAPLLGVRSTMSTTGPASYQFSASRFYPSTNGDAATGTDAGTGSAALPVAAGCIGGTVGGVDRTDEFVFTLPAGDAVTISVASSSPSLAFDLLSPVGQRIATVAAGQLLDLGSIESGQYVLTASSSSLSADAYVVGLIMGPPGCKPNC